MTDQEIIKKYQKEIEEDIQSICKTRGIIDADEIKKVSERYKSNFVQGFREGEYKQAMAVAKKMLSKQKSIDEIMELTELTKEQIESL